MVTEEPKRDCKYCETASKYACAVICWVRSGIVSVCRKAHRNPFEFIVALGTLALAYFAFATWEEMAKQTEASTRAYIAMLGVKFDGKPEAGKNQRLKILFKNVGKEPASDFHLLVQWGGYFTFEPDQKDMPYIYEKSTNWTHIRRCDYGSPQKIVGERPIYPDVMNEGLYHVFNSEPFLPQRLIDGKASFYIYGCGLYRSLGKPQQSPFCFYYQPARNLDIMQGTFEWCPVGAGNAS